MKAPRRRFTLEIRISADTLDDAYAALGDIERDRPKESVLGGSSRGWIVKLTEDPEMTNAKYHAAVEAYLSAKEVSTMHPGRAGGGDDDCA
jgi:hypothetical protein